MSENNLSKTKSLYLDSLNVNVPINRINETRDDDTKCVMSKGLGLFFRNKEGKNESMTCTVSNE